MSNNKIITKIVTILVTVVLLSTPVFAQNTTSNKSTTTNTKATTKSSTSKTKVEEDTDVFLNKLEIAGVVLEPAFNKDLYQYKVAYEGDETKLEIVTEANEEKANVEIFGNNNLIDGENILTIVVSNAKGTKSKTYQLYVNKNLIKQEELNKQLEEAEKEYQIKQWIIRGLIVVIAICIIILFILRYKTTNSQEYMHQKNQEKINQKLDDKEKFTNPYVEDEEIEEEPKKSNKKRKGSGKHSK